MSSLNNIFSPQAEKINAMKTSINFSFPKAKDYLYSLINYELKPIREKRELKLDRVNQLCLGLKLEIKQLPCIHIAGTKGKGSVVHFIANFLAQKGLKIGLYTSPHFYDLRERISLLEGREGKIKRKLIDKYRFAQITCRVKECIEKNNLPITFFEALTVIALAYFKQEKVNYAVIETGLGGRLDATNVVNPCLTIITKIDYDHTHILGKRLTEIAWEKSGIIKEKVPLITTCQRQAAGKVIFSQAIKKNSDVYLFGRDFFISCLKRKKDKVKFDFWFKNNCWRNISFGYSARYWIENLALALAGYFMLEPNKKLPQNITKLKIPGRWEEVFVNGYRIILDVAHNPISIQALTENINNNLTGKKIIVIFAASKDKNIRKMLSYLNCYKIILTKFNNPRAFEPKQILERKYINNALLADTPKQALEIAKKFYDNQSVILVTGSFFLVGELKEYFKNYVS